MLPAAITVILVLVGIVLAGIYASSKFTLLSMRVETTQRAVLELSERVAKQEQAQKFLHKLEDD